MKKIILSILGSLSTFLAFSQVQSVAALDPSYDADGVMSIAASYGKSVVAGYSERFFVAASNGEYLRILAFDGYGNLATDFGSKGAVDVYMGKGASVTPTSMAVDSLNGIVYVAVSANSAPYFSSIVSVFKDGTINKKLGGSGVVPVKLSYIIINAIGIQSSGKLVMAGDSLGGNYNYYAVTRMNADGSIDTEFKNPLYKQFGGVKGLAINNKDEIALTGSASTGNFAVFKLQKDGQRDLNFSDQGGIQISGLGSYEKAAYIAFQPDGKVVVAGVSAGGDYKVLRYTSKGIPDTAAFNRDGALVYGGKPGVFTYASSGVDMPNNIIIDQHGRILVTGYTALSDTMHSAIRLQPDGTLDKYFGYVTLGYRYLDYSYGSLITRDERLMMVGMFGTSITLAKIYLKYAQTVNFNPIPQQYIGSDPYYLVATASSGDPVAFSIDKPSIASVNGDELKARDTGRAVVTAFVKSYYTSGKPEYYPAEAYQALSVALNPPAYIGGPSTVATGSEDVFAIIPSNTQYTYKWSFSDGINSYILGSSSDDSVTIYFNRQAEGGILTCDIYNVQGALYASIQKRITVSEDATEAGGIETIACPLQMNSCYGNYIDDFKFNSLLNAGSGCSIGGYSDYTASGLNTSVFLGGVYSAYLKVSTTSASMNRYFGLWIDYNNDGDFTDADDFLGSAYTSDTLVALSNIVIKNNKDYTGPRRLRIRCRSNLPFTSLEACQQANESGETEDYMVFVRAQDALQGPNVITPNNDGKNDYLVFRGVNPKEGNKLVVFDRLGDVKFTRENYRNDWDGKDESGDLLSRGTYYYIFTNGSGSVKGFFEVLY